MKINSIPTRFCNCNFRSRLEAKWASFFNLLNWKWEYEPIDLNGWIPDFTIHGKAKPVLVEVKPALTTENLLEYWPHYFPRVPEEYDFLLIGAGLIPGYDGYDRLFLGWAPLRELAEYEGGRPSAQGLTKMDYGAYDYQDILDNYTCRLSGVRDQDCLGCANEEIMSLWRRACNPVQWKAPLTK